jgi:hypothetical protein
MHEFSRSTPVLVNLSLPTGSVDIIAEDSDSISVEVSPVGSSRQDREASENTIVELHGDELRIESPKGTGYMRETVQLQMRVHVPTESSLKIGVASAPVKCIGRFRAVSITSASGDVEVEEASGDVRLRSASGALRIESVSAKFNARTASGNVTANTVVGPSTLRSSSGDMEIASIETDLKSKNASGALKIGSAHTGTIIAQSASGEISVGVKTATALAVNLESVSGRVSNALETSNDGSVPSELTIQARSKSGDIEIVSASD